MAKTLVFTTALCALMSACTAPRPPEPAPYVAPPVTRPAVPAVALVSSPANTPSHATKLSLATTPKMYRVDGAHHLYDTYPERIYKGKLPPLMHAVVVTEIDLDAAGNVRDIQMLRVPSHAPEVVVKIREMIRAASPLPAPARMGGTHYTDIWLVDKSGRFQLDTLTEGQL
jgi:hypothetical protein